jgi:hypothetical protein
MADLIYATCTKEESPENEEIWRAELKHGDKIIMTLETTALESEWEPGDGEDQTKYQLFGEAPMGKGFLAVWLFYLCTASFPEDTINYWEDSVCRPFRETTEIWKNKRIVKFKPAGFEKEMDYLKENGYLERSSFWKELEVLEEAGVRKLSGNQNSDSEEDGSQFGDDTDTDSDNGDTGSDISDSDGSESDSDGEILLEDHIKPSAAGTITAAKADVESTEPPADVESTP